MRCVGVFQPRAAGAQSELNGNIAYRLAGGHLSMTFYGENLTNRTYMTRTANLTSSSGYALAQFGPPMTFGIRLRYVF